MKKHTTYSFYTNLRITDYIIIHLMTPKHTNMNWFFYKKEKIKRGGKKCDIIYIYVKMLNSPAQIT